MAIFQRDVSHILKSNIHALYSWQEDLKRIHISKGQRKNLLLQVFQRKKKKKSAKKMGWGRTFAVKSAGFYKNRE